jgi:hypothetical protein
MGTSIMIANWLTIDSSLTALFLSLRFFSSERPITHIILFLFIRVYTFFQACNLCPISVFQTAAFSD